MAEFKIYASSAGSGKTFTLTKEYLKIVLSEEDPYYFKKILAITFTNDAAQEMKSRIINSLKELSKGQKTPMMTLILSEISEIDETELVKRASNIFHEILHNYSDFSVKTIDSFVNQIVGSFAFDLNLPYNYQIVLQAKEVFNEAIHKLLEKVGQEEYKQLSTLFADFALGKIEEEKSWNDLPNELTEFATALLDDEAIFQFNKNDKVQLNDYTVFKKNIQAYLRQTENIIKNLAKGALELISDKGLVMSDFHYGISGVYNFYLHLSSSPDILKGLDFPKSRHIDAFENDVWYSKTKAKATSSILIDEIKSELIETAEQMIEFANENRSKYILLSAIGVSLSKIPLLTFIKNEVEEQMKLRNEVFLSDFNRWIFKLVSDEPVPFIYERIGERFQHFMVDEFQDTSNIQFYNLLPLIDNALANNKFNMIVGDPKQSIYSWRGGNIELMLDLMSKNDVSLKNNRESTANQYLQIDNLCGFSQKVNLAYNYRSKKELVEFNNEFFELVLQNYKVENPSLEEVFEDFQQKVPNEKNTGGHVEISILENDDILIFERILNVVNDQLAAGFSLGDIAILVRNNKEAVKIANMLRNEGFEINSQDALKLQYNRELNLVIALAQYILNPKDLFKQFEVITIYKLIKGQVISTEPKFDFEQFMSNFPEIDLEVIVSLNYYALFEYLFDRLGLYQNKLSAPFIFTFLDKALEHFQTQSKDLSDYLTYWESNKSKFAISNANKEAITITTIHKSKGLEYEIVIMPYVNWETSIKKNTTKWLSFEDVDFEEIQNQGRKLISAPLISKNLELTGVQSQYQAFKELIFIENINTLYVAFTRAIAKLFIFSNAKKKNSTVDLIQNYLAQKNVLSNTDGKFIISAGAEQNFKQVAEVQPELKYVLENQKLVMEQRKLKLKADITDLSTKRNLGQLIHAIFEKIKYKTEVDTILQEFKKEYNIENFDAIEKHVWAVINHPDLSAMFETENEILNEATILGGIEHIYRPDRVIISASSVAVLDYKTGEKSDKHLKQIKAYGELIKQMGYQKIELKLVYLDPLEVVSLN